jgi:hypothetical protein
MHCPGGREAWSERCAERKPLMRNLKTVAIFIQWTVLALACAFLNTSARAETVEIASLRELAEYAAKSGNVVTMRPGVYKLIELLPIESMAERRERKQFQFMTFSGSNNVFNLNGVVIELDTALRQALRAPIHNNEFVISGHSNTLIGLTITCVGDGTSAAGALVSITGDHTTLRDCTFHVRGSFPYGYGDLFGKGSPSVISHRKHSGVHIVGSNTRLFGCRLFMRSFGHGYFVQGGTNQYFENCYVEGEMRSTDAMLAETSGPAFDVRFRTVGRNREGEHRVLPGYMKSLAEDGFRTYGQVRNLTFINCTARNMRGGFELRTREGVRVENCTAIGCERGFWIGSGVVNGSRGDAQYGPLLFVEGDNVEAEVELLPAESDSIVHALAIIHGSGHQVTIKASAQGQRTRSTPILVGYGTPAAGEGMAAIPEQPARRVILKNETIMPVELGERASDCQVVSRGPLRKNSGQNNQVQEQ